MKISSGAMMNNKTILCKILVPKRDLKREHSVRQYCTSDSKECMYRFKFSSC